MNQPNQKRSPSNTNHLLATLILSFVLHLITPATSDQPTYQPTDSIALNCGSSDEVRYNARSWIGDINSPKYSTIEKSRTSFPSEANPPPTFLPKIPYLSARVSTSEFNYSFPVTAGPKFIRLYFYPASYRNFTRADAIFAVRSGPYTLLNNFSAVLVVDSIPHTQGIVREFSLPAVDDHVLKITLTPSTTHPSSYAFINGIEIVSMPDELYFNPVLGTNGIIYVGQNDNFPTSNMHALELIRRLNVGGNAIDPSDDTGMYRSWESDDDYLTSNFKGSVPSFPGHTLYYEKIPNYTAPNNVYRVSRTMGANKTINSLNNLTWSFLVDNNFNYLVRLHFCDLQPEIVKPMDRFFKIYIDAQLAEPYASVIVWSGGNRKPVYRDFVVPMYRQSGNKRSNLSIDLHPNSQDFTTYVDASLNGIELFKVGGADKNLSEPNQDPVLLEHKKRGGLSQKTIVGIASTLVLSLVSGLVLLGFFLYRIKEKRVEVKESHSRHGMSLQASSFPLELCRHFSLVEIKAATKNFDDVFLIGVGGFGNVYKGYIDGGSTLVAIKRLTHESQQGKHEFLTEIVMLSQLRHLNLVSLIGYCNELGEMILIYDYMPRGTLRDHLYNTTNPPLPWKERLRICIGAARGLCYLHAGAKYIIIHRDMKTTNILLDENWVAKVSDFGLSRVCPTIASNAHISTAVKGTFGYLDPEYFYSQHLTEKSDVYSFGVVLFEVLCARPVVNRNVKLKETNLALWAKSCCRKGTIDQNIDPHLIGKIAPECLRKFCEIALSCIKDEGHKRPSMNDVVQGLEFVLQLQETTEQDSYNEEGIVATTMIHDEDIKYLFSDWCEDAFSVSDAKSSRQYDDNSYDSN